MESPPYNKQTPDQKDHVYDNIRNGKTKCMEKRFLTGTQRELLGMTVLLKLFLDYFRLQSEK